MNTGKCCFKVYNNKWIQLYLEMFVLLFLSLFLAYF